MVRHLDQKLNVIINNMYLNHFYISRFENAWIFSCRSAGNKPYITYREWGNWPNEKLSNIKKVVFNIIRSDNFNINDAIPFLEKLPELELLSMPIDLFFMVKDFVCKNIKELILLPPTSDFLLSEWPSEYVMNKLTSLTVPELITPFYIYSYNFPNLQRIEYDLGADRKGYILNNLSEFPHINQIKFDHARNLDVFLPFKNHSIVSLELFACTGSKFPVDKIVELKELKYLYMNNIKSNIDCHSFLKLSQLEEIEIRNSKHLYNISSLLQCEKLSEIIIVDCNNPFKNGLSEMFKKHDFKSLLIDYA